MAEQHKCFSVPEVRGEIAKWVHVNDQVTSDEGGAIFSSAKSLSMVNKAFRTSSVPILFRSTTLEGHEDKGNHSITPKLQDFARLGRHTGLPDIRDHIRHLSIIIYHRKLAHKIGTTHSDNRQLPQSLANAINAIAGCHRRRVLASLWLDLCGLAEYTMVAFSFFCKDFKFRIASISFQAPGNEWIAGEFLKCCQKQYLERLSSVSIDASSPQAWINHRYFTMFNLKYLQINIEQATDDVIIFNDDRLVDNVIKFVPKWFPNLEELDIYGSQAGRCYGFAIEGTLAARKLVDSFRDLEHFKRLTVPLPSHNWAHPYDIQPVLNIIQVYFQLLRLEKLALRLNDGILIVDWIDAARPTRESLPQVRYILDNNKWPENAWRYTGDVDVPQNR